MDNRKEELARLEREVYEYDMVIKKGEVGSFRWEAAVENSKIFEKKRKRIQELQRLESGF